MDKRLEQFPQLVSPFYLRRGDYTGIELPMTLYEQHKTEKRKGEDQLTLSEKIDQALLELGILPVVSARVQRAS